MQDALIVKLTRAGDQRFAAATELLQMDRFRLEAMYLAGYTVELCLKALILSHTPSFARESRMSEFKRKERHNIEHLKASLRGLGRMIPDGVNRSLIYVSMWNTELRYEVGVKSFTVAAEFVSHTRKIMDWSKGILG
jgi:hypothetical protein